MFFLTTPASAPPLFSEEARKALGKRVQQMPTATPNAPRCYHLHGLRGRDERVVVYDNGIGGTNGKPGLVPDNLLLAHPTTGVFASIGTFSLQIVPVGDQALGEAWEIQVIASDPHLPVTMPDLDDPELSAIIAEDLAAPEDNEWDGDLHPSGEPDAAGDEDERNAA